MTDPTRDPLLADCAAAHLLSGLSGAAVYMITHDNRHWFVRKGAATPAGNARLRLQAEKQSIASCRPRPVARAAYLGRRRSRWSLLLRHGSVRGLDGMTYLRTVDYCGAAGSPIDCAST